MSPGSPRSRRPRWVYDEGVEPDYRFSLANERTFLAWLRTALGLIAGGVAVDVVLTPEEGAGARVLGILLLLLGIAAALLAAWRWAGAERAMRRGDPLPGFGLLALLPAGLVLVGALTWVVVG